MLVARVLLAIGGAFLSSGPALAAKVDVRGKFLSRTGDLPADPKWNGTSVQGDEIYRVDYPKDDNNVHPGPHGTSKSVQPQETYHADYPKDENGGAHKGAVSDHTDVKFSPARSHSAQWYRDQCTQINLRCESRKEEVERTQASEVHRLEERYKHQTKVLGGFEDSAEEAAHTASEQKTEVREVSTELKEVRTTYEQTKKCPAELKQLEQQLKELEAQSNDSEEDIDAECQKKKEILEKEKCVDSYVKAERVLSRTETTYTEEKQQYSEDKAAAEQAAQATSPHERRVDETRQVLEETRSEHNTDLITRIDEECKAEVTKLRRLADEEVAAAHAAYERHQRRLDSKEEVHHEAKEDVREQRETVRAEKSEVEEATASVEAKKSCQDELEQAEQELERLQSNPNESEEDIDAECQKKKEILAKRRCVTEYVAAKDVLRQTKWRYSSETEELEEHRYERKSAKVAVHGAEEAVHDFEKAWKASQEARQAIGECVVDESSSSWWSGGSDSGNPGNSDNSGNSGNSATDRKNFAGAVSPAAVTVLLGPLLSLAFSRV